MKISSLCILASITSAGAFAPSAPPSRVGEVAATRIDTDDGDSSTLTTRRATLESLVGAAAAMGVLASPNSAMAFDNRISTKYDDRPKQRGAKVSKIAWTPNR